MSLNSSVLVDLRSNLRSKVRSEGLLLTHLRTAGQKQFGRGLTGSEVLPLPPWGQDHSEGRSAVARQAGWVIACQQIGRLSRSGSFMKPGSIGVSCPPRDLTDAAGRPFLPALLSPGGRDLAGPS